MLFSLSEFCEVFQRGYDYNASSNTDDTIHTCRDVQVQTEIKNWKEYLKKKNDFEIFVLNKSGGDPEDGDETWKFSKNFRRQLKQPVAQQIKYRGRGRPRKNVIIEPPNVNITCTNADENKSGNEEKENFDKNLTSVNSMAGDEEKVVSERNGSNAIDVHAKVKVSSVSDRKLPDQPTRVSKRGRVIKPKVFSDDIICNIKKEVMGDSDSDQENSQSATIEDGTAVRCKTLDNIEGLEGVKIETSLGLYACDKCEYRTADLKEYDDHQRAHLHDSKMCSYCGWVCDNPDVSAQEFEEHLKKHSGPQPFFCNICSARFKTRTKLFLHLPKHSKIKPFVCSICHTGFKWKHALKNHMNVHKTTKDYLCDICGFSTAHKTQLKAHHLIHTGDTFKCTEPGCNYQATKKTNLKFHMMTHTREKPHQCEVCGTSFSLFKNMKRHMLLHTSERPYRCENCTFCTTRFDKLKEHYFKQHNIGEKPAKKFRLSEYIKTQEGSVETENIMDTDSDDIIKTTAEDLNLTEDMETIELQVASEENGAATTQILNLTSATGEAIPIAITQLGADISYEIQQFPIQFVTQEIVTDS